MFEEGRALAAKYGAENVFDFSLGNPNVPAPDEVNRAMIDIIKNTDSLKLHGYMSNAGHEDVRAAIADSLNKRFGTDYDSGCIIMTVGAAGGLNVILKAILDPKDEVITFAPYFGEYDNYVSNFDGKIVSITPILKRFSPILLSLRRRSLKRPSALLLIHPITQRVLFIPRIHFGRWAGYWRRNSGSWAVRYIL